MDFQSLLATKIKEQGFTIKKLADLTGIVPKHLENLISGNFTDLPPSPYIHGYFIKIGQVLNYDGEELWQNFREESEVASSGSLDRLPQNRFIRQSPAKKIWFGVIVLIIVSYFGIRFSKILGQPSLSLLYPEQNLATVSANEITVRGKLSEGDKLTVNGEEVIPESNGLWSKDVSLEPGINIIEVIAKKFLGRETRLTRQVVYEPLGGNVTPIVPASSPTSSEPGTTSSIP